MRHNAPTLPSGWGGRSLTATRHGFLPGTTFPMQCIVAILTCITPSFPSFPQFTYCAVQFPDHDLPETFPHPTPPPLQAPHAHRTFYPLACSPDDHHSCMQLLLCLFIGVEHCPSTLTFYCILPPYPLPTAPHLYCTVPHQAELALFLPPSLLPYPGPFTL